jgi:hypothetical protein
MSIFTSVMSDLSKTEESLLGPTYKYYEQIKTPDQLGMSSKGDISTLTKDVKGLLSYTSLLVSGNSDASVTKKPLGNQFFLKTGAKCKDIKTQNLVDRYIYVNNIPDGRFPLVSSIAGVDFKEFRGLVPGTLSNAAQINPLQMLQSFMTGSNPECQEIEMSVVNNQNRVSREKHHVTTLDIQNIPPCWFSEKFNPVTRDKCGGGKVQPPSIKSKKGKKEKFSNISETIGWNINHGDEDDDDDNYILYNELNSSSRMPDEIITQVYISTLTIFTMYLILKAIKQINII